MSIPRYFVDLLYDISSPKIFSLYILRLFHVKYHFYFSRLDLGFSFFLHGLCTSPSLFVGILLPCLVAKIVCRAKYHRHTRLFSYWLILLRLQCICQIGLSLVVIPVGLRFLLFLFLT